MEETPAAKDALFSIDHHVMYLIQDIPIGNARS
jgi:hypothetical protein